jgi:RNA polymerase sigma factor (sigma-70 family)
LRASADGFEAAVAPHLGAAYNLARWLLRDERDAEDVVQEALLRAFKGWAGFTGANLRGWLLAVVRNACFTFLERRKHIPVTQPLEDEERSLLVPAGAAKAPEGPEAELLRAQTGEQIAAAVSALPLEFREVFLLREVEGLSYKEIAEVVAVPMGTVMSRLSRARGLLRRALGGVGAEVAP